MSNSKNSKRTSKNSNKGADQSAIDNALASVLDAVDGAPVSPVSPVNVDLPPVPALQSSAPVSDSAQSATVPAPDSAPSAPPVSPDSAQGIAPVSPESAPVSPVPSPAPSSPVQDEVIYFAFDAQLSAYNTRQDKSVSIPPCCRNLYIDAIDLEQGGAVIQIAGRDKFVVEAGDDSADDKFALFFNDERGEARKFAVAHLSDQEQARKVAQELRNFFSFDGLPGARYGTLTIPMAQRIAGFLSPLFGFNLQRVGALNSTSAKETKAELKKIERSIKDMQALASKVQPAARASIEAAIKEFQAQQAALQSSIK